MLSDAYKIDLIDDIVYEVDCKVCLFGYSIQFYSRRKF